MHAYAAAFITMSFTDNLTDDTLLNLALTFIKLSTQT